MQLNASDHIAIDANLTTSATNATNAFDPTNTTYATNATDAADGFAESCLWVTVDPSSALFWRRWASSTSAADAVLFLTQTGAMVSCTLGCSRADQHAG